jgi:hypothetical protein
MSLYDILIRARKNPVGGAATREDHLIHISIVLRYAAARLMKPGAF